MAHGRRSRNLNTMLARRMAVNAHPKRWLVEVQQSRTASANIVIEHRRGGKFEGEHYATEPCELCNAGKKSS